MIERANQEIEKALKRMADKSMSSWDLFLGRATRAINTRNIIALRYMPFEILFGIQPRLLFELSYPDEDLTELRAWAESLEGDLPKTHWRELILSNKADVREIRDEVIERWKKRNKEMKELCNKGIKGWHFKAGDLVMLYDNTVGTKSKASHKLGVQWPGPYLVLGPSEDHGTSYYLCYIHGKKLPGTHHGDHLTLYCSCSSHLAQPFDDIPTIGL